MLTLPDPTNPAIPTNSPGNAVRLISLNVFTIASASQLALKPVKTTPVCLGFSLSVPFTLIALDPYIFASFLLSLRDCSSSNNKNS